MRQKILELSLLSQCALADNRQAFGRLVEMHTPQVRRFLLNPTHGDAALTDDLSQETYIKAYISIRRFNGLSHFSTWLYKIAYNEYMAWLRRRSDEPLDPGYDAPDTGPDDDDSRTADVMEAVDALAEPTRSIVILFYCEDRPIKEIAQILGLNINTVKVYLKRGRDRLQQKFSK